MRTHWVLASLLLALASHPAEASGKREARSLFKKGNKLLLAGDYVGALRHLEDAYAAYPSPKILVNIGTCLLEMGRNAEAATTFERYLADPEAESERTAEIEEIIARLDSKLAHLRVPIVEEGTRVLLDGQPVDPEHHGSFIRIEPGSHAVVAERPGSSPTVATVVLAAGERREVDLELATEPASPPDLEATDPRFSDAEGAKGPSSGTGAAATASASDLAGPDLTIDAPGDPSSLGHHGQLGAWVRTDLDGESVAGERYGAVLVAGVSLGIGSHFEPSFGVIVGQSNRGIEPGLKALLLRGPWKPIVYVGAPGYFDDGTYWGVHAAAGLQWDASRRLGLYATAGVQHFPSVPPHHDATLIVPSIGLQGRL